MGIDVTDTIAGIEVLRGQFHAAMKDITTDALRLIQVTGQKHAPIGTPGNSTDPPGTLGRSIVIDGPTGTGGTYTGQVGPTTRFGRQRELGGEIFPQTAKALVFQRFGTTYVIGPTLTTHYEEATDTWFIRKPSVYQKPQPYMKPARAEMLAPILVMAQGRIALVIEAASGG